MKVEIQVDEFNTIRYRGVDISIESNLDNSFEFVVNLEPETKIARPYRVFKTLYTALNFVERLYK